MENNAKIQELRQSAITLRTELRNAYDWRASEYLTAAIKNLDKALDSTMQTRLEEVNGFIEAIRERA
jgi:hypothetical protein